MIAPKRALRFLKFLAYPTFFWRICQFIPNYLHQRYFPTRPWARSTSIAARIALYALVGLPATLFITGEVAISLNELIVGENEEHRPQNDFEVGRESSQLVLPGTPTPMPEAVEAGPTEEYRQYLVERHAPVIIQRVSAHPEWDVPVAIDFDGNEDPRDNVKNEPRYRPPHAVVYGEVTAETEDAYYLTYSLYHVKDYDHPVREAISDWTFHDNDNEGFTLRVEKQSMRVTEAEAWFHNRFLLFNTTGISEGTEPTHGKIHFENDTHPIIYAQAQGHGVRLAQSLDQALLMERVKLLRWRGQRAANSVSANDQLELDATYELRNFDTWYKTARGPFGSEGQGPGMFEETISLGTDSHNQPIVVGRFIAGRDYAKGSWSRPKPMWSWDDGWDDVPIAIWHFYPSHAYASHAGLTVSHHYLYNRPIERIFGVPADDFYNQLTLKIARRKDDKWKGMSKHLQHVDHSSYWKFAKLKAKEYVNYLFHALG